MYLEAQVLCIDTTLISCILRVRVAVYLIKMEINNHVKSGIQLCAKRLTASADTLTDKC